jgi:DNA-binding MarR family transcriptional regulator
VLADALGVAPRTITTLIDALVSTGFVSREPHPSDRRATLVTFTSHGQDTARALVAGHRRLARELFEDLPPEVFDDFDAGLVHVTERLRHATGRVKQRARPTRTRQPR